MFPQNEGVLLTMPAASAATTATQSLTFDSVGYDHANLYVMVGTFSTSGETLRTIDVADSDTVTSFTSMTDIVAFAVGTATSTSVPNSMPAETVLGLSTTMEFQVDLRKRKRYVGIGITPGTTTVNIGVLARLTQSRKSADSAAEKAAVTNNVVTAATQCALVVSG